MNPTTRRAFLSQTGLGLGSAALASLMGPTTAFASASNPQLPQFAAKAKRVIFLCMAGGPSHLETFDFKPDLNKLDGKPMPESFTRGQPIAQLQGEELKVLGHQTAFRRYGRSGQLISDYLPWTAKMADDIAIVRSMVTEQINHDPAHTFMNTGTAISGRPSMGSWVNYGLGSDSEDLPGFVVLTSVGGRNPQPIASRQWSSGFLPSRYQGVEFNGSGDPVHYVSNPKGVLPGQQAALVKAIGQLDRNRNQTVHNPEIDTRIAAYEMAFRMQTSVPELTDVSSEPSSTFELYGEDARKPGTYANNCLLARRLAERDVRFIQLFHRGWDAHNNLPNVKKRQCGSTDQASAGLIQDLKQRGLLKDTLVIWGGEFGRTVYCQDELTDKTYGRDHHPRCFSMFMAGGGSNPGMSYGETDDFSYNIAKDPVSVHDLHATILHMLGVDHKKLTYKFQGRHYRLTDVHGKVIKPLLA